MMGKVRKGKAAATKYIDGKLTQQKTYRINQKYAMTKNRYLTQVLQKVQKTLFQLFWHTTENRYLMKVLLIKLKEIETE